MHARPLPRLAAAALALTLLPALAVYKVEHADGTVTYTDRPADTGSARVTSLGRDAAPPPLTVVLPQELRLLVQRYPVTLYTAPDCIPCDGGRRLLQQRGVPYTERVVVSSDDAAALERVVGGRTVPALTIGAQPLRGLSEADWTAYLDAAGYPRESRLPRGWQPPPPAPLAERAPAEAAARAPTAAPAARPAPPAPPTETPPPGTLRF
jgi:glutaredoxin